MPVFGYLLPVFAAAVSALLAPAVAAVALLLGAVDYPGGRRRHAGPTPSLGGVAIFAALVASLGLASLLVSLRPSVAASAGAASLLGPGWPWLVAGAVAALATGMVDDFRRLGVTAKLAGQTIAATCAVAGGCVVTGVTNPLGDGAIGLGLLAWPMTIGWMLLVINAVNLIDGLDGLAAGTTVIIALGIAILAQLDGRPEPALLAAIVAGASLGFLVHNWHPARIFLGDSGSLLLGYSLAVLSVQSLQKGATATLILAPVLTLALPLLDTAAAIVRRASRAGLTGIVRADTGHVHHRLVDLGFTPRHAVVALYAACAGFGLAAVAVRDLHGAGQAAVVFSLAAVVFLASWRFGRTGSSRSGAPSAGSPRTGPSSPPGVKPKQIDLV